MCCTIYTNSARTQLWTTAATAAAGQPFSLHYYVPFIWYIEHDEFSNSSDDSRRYYAENRNRCFRSFPLPLSFSLSRYRQDETEPITKTNNDKRDKRKKFSCCGYYSDKDLQFADANEIWPHRDEVRSPKIDGKLIPIFIVIAIYEEIFIYYLNRATR